MKLFFKQVLLIAIVAFTFLLGGCDKTKLYDVDVPPPLAHFVGGATRVYSVVDNPTPSFTLQIGTTDVASSDRTVTYNVTSPSGAVAGVQYTISGIGTVNIPANAALANVIIQANYAEYAAGRKDTLVFSLATPSVNVATFQDTVTVILAGPSGCTEANPDLNTLLGDYTNTNELFGTNAYGPYTTSISSVTATSATTATVVVENIWDNGWGPISFDIDWTDPLNTTAVVVQQDAIPGSDAGDINATYAGQTIAVKAPSVALSATPGTYATCLPQQLVLKMQLGVTNLGYFNALYTVTMLRN